MGQFLKYAISPHDTWYVVGTWIIPSSACGTNSQNKNYSPSLKFSEGCNFFLSDTKTHECMLVYHTIQEDQCVL